MSRREIVAGVALMLGCWAVAWLSARAVPAAGCAQDLVPLVPDYQVDVGFSDGSTQSFCNVTCALLYLKDSRLRPSGVTVRDEDSGESLSAEDAFYVESEVLTHRESANSIHVFGARSAAEEHAEHYDGRLLASPFPAME